MKNPIIILGTARSGTSLIADLVRRWGAYAGDTEELLPADQWNPEGYWEYLPLKSFNDQLLASVGANERLPPQDKALLKIRATEPEYRDKAQYIFDSMQQRADCWFWKDPRLSILLPFWKKIWKDAVYIISIRNPVSIALSQFKMSGNLISSEIFPFSATFLYWQFFMLSILKDTDRCERKFFIEYETLLQQPGRECTRLARFLDSQLGDQKSYRQKADIMVQAINPLLYRNKTSKSFLRTTQATKEQRNLYLFLKQKVVDPDAPFKQKDFPLYVGWREYLQILDLLFQMLIQGSLAPVTTNWHDLIKQDLIP